jgi:predicted O-methyltransferase YrrM
MKELYNRLRSKIAREIRKKYWANAFFQKQMSYDDQKQNWYEPVMAGPLTFMDVCSNSDTIQAVSNIITKLEPDDYINFNIDFFQTGLERFGKKWRYMDINTVLYGICSNITVESYLEIGVRRGRSMSIVASLHPDAAIVGFDMWIENYTGMKNPGPLFVQNELKKVGYRNNAEFVSGNSRYTIPDYFKKNPDSYYDVITVDGDHTERGAVIDIRNVIPRLKVGGFIVFDDICNPSHPHLKKVWRKTVQNNSRFMSYSFEEVGYGVSFAIKKY